MDIITRSQAKAAGLTKYFTGKPCKHGHIAERRISDGCIVCADKHARDWCYVNKEKVSAKGKAYRAKNRDKLNAKNKDWRKSNLDKHKELTLAWRAANTERVKQVKKDWKRINAGRVNASNMRRYIAKLRQTPQWADLIAIESIYERASEQRKMGFDVHVDHIIPLRGETVSGLHVHNNLQIIDAHINRSKSNNFIGV